MKVTVKVPASLREYLDGNNQTVCNGSTIAECFDNLNDRFSGFKENVLDNNNNKICKSIIIFLNGENIQNLEGLATPVSDGNEISIIPFAAGG